MNQGAGIKSYSKKLEQNTGSRSWSWNYELELKMKQDLEQ